jgi:hypothetical protein
MISQQGRLAGGRWQATTTGRFNGQRLRHIDERSRSFLTGMFQMMMALLLIRTPSAVIKELGNAVRVMYHFCM